MNLNKRALLDAKANISHLAHEFEFECIYLKTYLDDSIQLIEKANYLPKDAKIYSLESDKYFWSVNHTFYFTSSFMAMLMQIGEDLVNQYCKEWDLILMNPLKIEKLSKPFYEKVRLSLQKNAGLHLKTLYWEELSNLYQLRNALIHQNGRLNHQYPDRVASVQNLVSKYKCIELRDQQIFISERFCLDALIIFEKALKALFKETNSYINILKKTI